MTAAYLRGRMYYCHVPLEDGRTRVRKAGTTDRATARTIDRMLDILKGKRDWELLHAAAFGRLAVGELWDAYRAGEAALARLRARLNDVDLATYVDEWQRWLATQLGSDSPAPAVYRTYVCSLMTYTTTMGSGAEEAHGDLAEQRREQRREQHHPFYRSELTTGHLVRWLAALPVGASTKRYYRSGVSSFFKYLKLVGVLDHDPMRDVDAPAAGPPRERYLDHMDVLRLVEAQAEPYRTVSALIHGAGLELTVALGLTRADVDAGRRRVRARGTKMARRQRKRARDRYARVEAWAWAYLERHLAANPGLPAASIFPDVSPKMARARHREACQRLGIVDYRPHDARHTYAVRAIRAGASPRVVSKQLGHVDEQMVMRVYAKHEPDDSDYHWEETAAARDGSAHRPDHAAPQSKHPDHHEARSP